MKAMTEDKKPEELLSITPEEFAFENGIINSETIAIGRMKLEQCYHEIIEIFKRYVDMPEEHYKIIALWIIGTYFHDSFNSYPFLFFNAMRGSGKTRVLRLIASLGNKGNGKLQNSLTEAGLFRIPKGTTTCIDEFEQINSKEKQSLRELLNASYKKGVEVKRLKKVKFKGEEGQVYESFEVYVPIAMANIFGLEEVLSDRAITLILEKSNNSQFTKKIEDFDSNPQFFELKRTLSKVSVVCVVYSSQKNIYRKWNNFIDDRYTTTQTTLTTTYTYTNNNYNKLQRESEKLDLIKEIELTELFNKIDDVNINGRNFELLFPLIMIARLLGDEYLTDALNIFKRINQEKREDEFTESKDVSFIDFISTQNSYRYEYIQVKELTDRFRTYLGERESEERWLNDRWVGRALKRLNLVGSKKRVASGILVLLNVDKAKEKIKIFKDENDAQI